MLAMVFTTNGAPLVTATLQAQNAPIGAGFNLDAGDLRFILRQIKIAEAHAAGGNLSALISDVRLPFGLRTVDGSFNHLGPNTTTFGQADQAFPRLTAPSFRPAENAPSGAATSYAQRNGTVFDSQPRLISNLIADQTSRNPAAVIVSTAQNPAPPPPDGSAPVPPAEGETLPIFNEAPDVNLSAPFNSMFTFFGQFFDHGLDLVTKGGNGAVLVPLKADDPLFSTEPGALNFMALTRATMRDCSPATTPNCIRDGIGDNPATPGIDESANDVREATNTTTPFVDQNQTYTSHPSHQVFLREYVMDGGRPRSTGRMIEGGGDINGVAVKNIANWKEVKDQALEMLGIQLTDADIFNVPELETDAYGRFVRSADGFPKMKLAAGGTKSGTPSTPITTADAAKTGHAFLDDIAHPAVPSPGLTPDGGPGDGIGPHNARLRPGTYDNELLDAHFVTGDGRGNENIALTAVHTVFHAEHNRLRDEIDALIHKPGVLTAAEIADWEADLAPAGYDYGERLFQAARFVTEMEYQHLVFEEFARKLAPSINPFLGDGINFQGDTNPAISAEFAHQVYRLGHSMLNETIERITPTGAHNDIDLFDGFLNPRAFNDDGTLTAAQAAGQVFQGMTQQVGMEIDEFVTEAVRSRLLGLPLDLAVLNLARGRSEGVAGLNSVRRQLYETSGGDTALLPYANWLDFKFSIKHPESLTNFVAAYGTHPTITGADTVKAKRDAAKAIVNATSGEPLEFMLGVGDHADVNGLPTTGLENIDLWMGGLAERIAPFGGMLGSTFNYIFERQLEDLQNADRFYYLERLDGLNLLQQLEANSFAELISRNVALNGPPADVFSRPGLTFNLDAQTDPNGIVDDPATNDGDPATDIDDETVQLVRMPDGTIRYGGDQHVNWIGRDGANDKIWSSEGDDTLRGNGGDDRMEGGSGNDQIIGGAGDDILTDLFGDDVIKGGPGNDAISGGASAFDLLQGNDGDDFIVGGIDFSEIFGGNGDDVMFTGEAGTEGFGGAGDDWIEAGPQLDLLVGDENNQFQNDPAGGHDVIIGGKGDDDYDAEGGDDIMVGDVLGTERFEGMLGFDWVTYRGDPLPVDADMGITGVLEVAPNPNELRDRFDLTEGLSGWDKNDILRGDNTTTADLTTGAFGTVPDGHVLNAAGIARIAGLAGILPAGATSFSAGNIILGGGGSDIIEGRGGDDILDGDRWLDVQLSAPNLSTPDLTDVLLYDGMRLAPSRCLATPGSCNPIEARTLQTAVFATTNRINPGTIEIVRSIKATNAETDVDTAVFTGPRANYAVSVTGTGANRVITVSDTVGLDGTDTIRNVERLQFTDQIVVAGGLTAGIPVPNVAGLSQAAAIAAIDVNFTVGTITSQNSNTIAFGVAIGTDPLAGIGATSDSVVNLVMSLGPQIADVHDHTVEAARLALFELGGLGIVEPLTDFVNHAEIAAGLVVTTNPAPGGIVAPGGSVRLIISLGPAVPGTIPAVAGLLEGDATELILAAGFNVAANGLRFVTSATVPAGVVISTNPAAGSKPALGSNVIVTVSLGAEGLVAAFGFDEATGTVAINSSAPATDGTIRQALRVPGRFGGALSFDGVNDWVTVTDVANSALDLSNGMTIEAWVMPTGPMSGWETIVMKERGAAGSALLSYAMYAHDGAPTDAAGFTGPAAYLRAAPVNSTTDQVVRDDLRATLPQNEWTHLATTYDGAMMHFYVNGALVGSKAQTGNIAAGNQALRIGGNNVSPGEFFRGVIDEVRIYNSARSADQIALDMITPIVR